MKNIWLIVGATVFVIWLFSMASWIRRGCPIPRYVHGLAGLLTVVGIVCAVFLYVNGIVHWPALLGLVLLPAPAAYFGWLWMFGPDFAQVDEPGS